MAGGPKFRLGLGDRLQVGGIGGIVLTVTRTERRDCELQVSAPEGTSMVRLKEPRPPVPTPSPGHPDCPAG